MSIKNKKKIIDLSISPKQESALKQGKSPFQANKRKSAFYMQANNSKEFILPDEDSQGDEENKDQIDSLKKS